MYKFVACDTIKTNGTHFQGTVKTTFDELVEVFFKFKGWCFCEK